MSLDDLPRLGLGTYSDTDRDQCRENVARIDGIDRTYRAIDPDPAPWNR